MAPPQRFYPSSWGFHPSGGCTAQLFNQGVRPGVSGARRSGRRGRRSEGVGPSGRCFSIAFRYVFGAGLGWRGCVWGRGWVGGEVCLGAGRLGDEGCWGCFCGAMPGRVGFLLRRDALGVGLLLRRDALGVRLRQRSGRFGRGGCFCGPVPVQVRSRPVQHPSRRSLAPPDTRRGTQQPRPNSRPVRSHPRSTPGTCSGAALDTGAVPQSPRSMSFAAPGHPHPTPSRCWPPRPIRPAVLSHPPDTPRDA